MGLTKEEKKALKEAKKLEKLRAATELRNKMKRDELQREMAAQALKRGEIDKTWREMMLKIKEPVFRQDIEVMWSTFERAYDKKDHLISLTMKLQDVADDQFQRTVASFCDTIDTMITKFLSELEVMEEDYNQRSKALLKKGEDDAARIMTDHTAAETHLQLMLFHAHTTADTDAWTVRGENVVKEDEEKQKFANIRENLRSFLEDSYNAMWDEYKAVLKAYVVNTADNQKKLRRLRKKESLMADIIASQGKKIANNDELLRKLRTELGAYESGTKQAVFRDRRNRHRDACQRLKNNLYRGVVTDVRQLTTLVRVTDDAVEWLEQGRKKCEKILRMAALCRKFETQREKVLPYGSTMPQSPTQAKITVRRQHSDDSLVVNAISSTCGLTRLWQRVANAELTKRALLREKTLLIQENEEIIRKIQERDNIDIGLDTFKCICGTSNTKLTIHKPVAIDGAIDLLKYRHRQFV